MPFDDVDVAKDDKLHEEEEDGKETREPVPICSLSDTKKHLEEIHRYFECCIHTTGNDFSAVNHLESAF